MRKRYTRLYFYMKALGITQRQAADKCGMKYQAISRIATCQEPPYPERGKRIADALGWPGTVESLFEEVMFDQEADHEKAYLVAMSMPTMEV